MFSLDLQQSLVTVLKLWAAMLPRWKTTQAIHLRPRHCRPMPSDTPTASTLIWKGCGGNLGYFPQEAFQVRSDIPSEPNLKQSLDMFGWIHLYWIWMVIWLNEMLIFWKCQCTGKVRKKKRVFIRKNTAFYAKVRPLYGCTVSYVLDTYSIRTFKIIIKNHYC